jgi:hypothetical protein
VLKQRGFSLSPSSLHNGTSDKSGSRLAPTWKRMLILWLRSQSDEWISMTPRNHCRAHQVRPAPRRS